MKKSTVLLLLCIGSISVFLGCGASQMKRASAIESLAPAPMIAEAESAPEVLTDNRFTRDHAGSISEENLRQVMYAPVFLENNARIGVVHVVDRYETTGELSAGNTTAVLTKALQDSGLFEAATEVSTDWPSDRGISGLRELAARYRTEYLLLYRVRFADLRYTNGWGWFYPTLLGILLVPGNTLTSFGIIEATLFDIKTGTILFSAFERFEGERKSTVWHVDLKWDRLKLGLVDRSAEKLAAQVVEGCRALDKTRREYAAQGVDVSPPRPNYVDSQPAALEQLQPPAVVPYGQAYPTTTD